VKKSFINELEWALISPQLAQVSILEEIINQKKYIMPKYKIEMDKETGKAVSRLVERLSPTEKKAAERSRDKANHIVKFKNSKKK